MPRDPLLLVLFMSSAARMAAVFGVVSPTVGAASASRKASPLPVGVGMPAPRAAWSSRGFR